MSKKKREAIERAITKQSANEKTKIPAEIENNNRRDRWQRLSFQTKLLTIMIIGLLTLGAFGAGWKYLDEDAKQRMAERNDSTPLNQSEETLLSKINPLVPAVSPSPTPQLSKEYIYAGSRLLAVEDANANAAPPADLSIFRPSTGGWWVLNSSGQGYTGQNWGVNGDVPVPGDFDGDGKTDFSIFHPSDGSWQVLQSSNGASYGFQFGVSSDKTAQADYDGDGKTDLAVYRPNQSGVGVWYIRKSNDGNVLIQQFGLPDDYPAPADYDGDGKADICVWRNSNQTFYSIGSSTNTVQIIGFLQSSTAPVSGDYDGDGKADYAIRSSTNWIIRNSTTGAIQTITPPNDLSTDIAVQNDYDGDGKVDIAVWRNSNGNWYIRKSGSNGVLRQEQWGMTGDIPVPAFYRR